MGRTEPNRMVYCAVACFLAGLLGVVLAMVVPRSLTIIASAFSLAGFAAAIPCSRTAIRRAMPEERRGRGACQVLSRASGILVVLVIIGTLGHVYMDRGYGPAGGATLVKCDSNLRLIHEGIDLYAKAHDGNLPPDLATLAGDPEVGLGPQFFVCPWSRDTPAPAATTQSIAAAFRADGSCSYRYIHRTSAVALLTPRDIVLYEPLSNHDGEGAHFVYGDGRIVWLTPTEASKLIAALEAGRQP
ncbi:MAG: type II secretion system protein [Tepidisphaerales bacterium]